MAGRATRTRHRQALDDPDHQAIMPSARHILIVNSRSVHQPVFVIGAPHSGAELIGRAVKASRSFHITIGEPSVLRVVYAFARRPSMDQGRPGAAATVIRDAFAQAWQVNAHSCLDCTRECRAAAGLGADAVGSCVELRGLETYGAEPRPHLLRGGAQLRVPRRPDRPGRQGRPGRGGCHAGRPGRDVLVPPQFREHRHRVPQSVLRNRNRGGREIWPQLSRPGDARCAGAGPYGSRPRNCTTAWPPPSSRRSASST